VISELPFRVELRLVGKKRPVVEDWMNTAESDNAMIKPTRAYVYVGRIDFRCSRIVLLVQDDTEGK
jgi:hypothetical protein